jgi:hypothetical protein
VRRQPPLPAPKPPAPVVVEPKPAPAAVAHALLHGFIAKGRDLPELATALRACTPQERALFGASVPYSTGLTGARCDQLRALFAGIAAEPAPQKEAS